MADDLFETAARTAAARGAALLATAVAVTA